MTTGKLTNFIRWKSKKFYGRIKGFGIDETYRRRGFGTSIFHTSVKIIVARRFTNITS